MNIYDEAQCIIYGTAVTEPMREEALKHLNQMKFSHNDYHALLVANACFEAARLTDHQRRVAATVEEFEAKLTRLNERLTNLEKRK